MEWIQKLNQAMNYIEEHITEEIDWKEVGKIAGCSSYHFQRMFGYMANVPLSEYIRRRRMSLAAGDLLLGQKVVDVALKYGYDSPTAFNRAFKSIHGIAPSRIHEGVEIKSFPPICFHISIKGDCEMNYRIEKKEAFKIAGISMPLEQEIEKNFENVPKMWAKAQMDGTIPRILSLMDAEPKGLLGVSACSQEGNWKYYIAAATTKDALDGMEEYVVPASTWAVFPGDGTGRTVQELECRIVQEWLPASGYEYADAPDIELYLGENPQDMKFEVWIPVRKKEELDG